MNGVAQRRSDDGIAGARGADVGSVSRFVKSVPTLRRLLASPAASDRELLLRSEMRRTIATLGATFDEAARLEQSATRVAVYRVAALAAAELASGGATLAPCDH